MFIMLWNVPLPFESANVIDFLVALIFVERDYLQKASRIYSATSRSGRFDKNDFSVYK